MSANSIIAKPIISILKPLGFKKKGSTWHMESLDSLTLIDLQKSSYGQAFYLNIGVWLKISGDVLGKLPPKEHKCHIRLRWSAIVNEDEIYLKKLLNLEDDSLDVDLRTQEIARIFAIYVMPFVNRLRSLEDIRDFYHSSSWPKSILVNKKGAEVLAKLD